MVTVFSAMLLVFPQNYSTVYPLLNNPSTNKNPHRKNGRGILNLQHEKTPIVRKRRIQTHSERIQSIQQQLPHEQ